MRKVAFEPCIPTGGTKVPPGPDWFHEIDGYRLIVQREGKRVRLLRKMVTLSMLLIAAATTTTLASAQEAALSEGERHGLTACLVKCPDGDKACNNRCISKSQTRGVVWSDGARACIRGCRTEYQLSQIAAQKAANEIFGCIAGCLDRMVR
jgi:hypothetical protein